MKELIVALQKINEEAPYRTQNVPNHTSGTKILSRLISISHYKKQLKEKEWSEKQKISITIKNKDLAQFFICWTATDILKRRTALKKLLRKKQNET